MSPIESTPKLLGCPSHRQPNLIEGPITAAQAQVFATIEERARATRGAAAHHAGRDEVVTCPCSRPSFLERAACDVVLGGMGSLDAAGLLRPVLRPFVNSAIKDGTTLGEPITTPQGQAEILALTLSILRAETADLPERKSWRTISDNVLGRCFPVPAATPARIGDVGFRGEMEHAIGEAFSRDNKCVFLPDGPAALGKRYRLLAKNPKRVWISSWRIENNATGRRISDELVKAAREGADVRVIVDGQVAARETHEDTLDRIVAAGGKVARYFERDNALDGLHAKICVIDDQFIVGGLNYGDPYSHGFDVPEPDLSLGKWRDTDMLVKGPAVLDACKRFGALWNDNVSSAADRIDANQVDFISGPDVHATQRTSDDVRARELAQRAFPVVKVRGADVAVVVSRPGLHCDENILAGYCKLIYGAQDRIDIENAYFIQLPPIRQALVDALHRGVKVRVHTNSLESVDEKSVAPPIIETCHELFLDGADIYLRKGTTLHSKFMQVDDRYTVVGSFNINPRSVQYDAESVCFIDSADFATGVRGIFEMDISDKNAALITKFDDFPSLADTKSRLTTYRFYDHL